MSSIIRSEENGIEFYTIAATGESGMSQSGLAILAGVHQTTISKLEKSLMHEFRLELVLANRCEYNYATIYKIGFCIQVLKLYARKGIQRSHDSLSLVTSVFDTKKIESQSEFENLFEPLIERVRLQKSGNSKLKAKDDLYVFIDAQRGVCKIGRSKLPLNRLSGVQCGYPFELSIYLVSKGKGCLEKRLHKLLDDFCLKGEWFDCSCLPIIDWSSI